MVITDYRNIFCCGKLKFTTTYRLQGEGLSIRKIAKELGRSPSTISRELNRPEALYYRGKYIGSQTDIRVKNKWKESHKRENPYLSLWSVPQKVDIDLRMEEANKRIEIGHFEADTIESRRIRGKQSSCLTVLVDRLSRKTIIKKTASKTSNMTSTSIIRAMKPYRNTIKSISKAFNYTHSKLLN